MPIIRLEVVGVVQGVGFRWFTREAARRLGVAGWVKNRADGAVEVAASADDAIVEQFVAALRRGPSGARVSEVRALDASAVGALPLPFAVARD